jgi:26S proteasome regulatory subunit T6
MMVEKVPDSTYEMVGGLDKQIKEIKEVIELPVKHPELFDALGISQPKVCLFYFIHYFDFVFHLGCFTLWSTGYR